MTLLFCHTYVFSTILVKCDKVYRDHMIFNPQNYTKYRKFRLESHFEFFMIRPCPAQIKSNKKCLIWFEWSYEPLKSNNNTAMEIGLWNIGFWNTGITGLWNTGLKRSSFEEVIYLKSKYLKYGAFGAERRGDIINWP